MDRTRLFNPRYGNLPREERESLLLSLPKCDGRFAFQRFERFERFGMATDTAVYNCKGAEFVFVPGGEATLGWDAFAVGPDADTLREIEDIFTDEFGYEEPPELEAVFRESMSAVRKVNIGPMLVERHINDIGWRNVASDSPELAPFQKDIKKHFSGTKLTISGGMRIFKDGKTGETRTQIYEPASLDSFLSRLHGEKFSLPTEDEWEYLCGGGSRTLFRWGDSFDYEMKLRHFEEACPSKDAPYTLKEPNQFGLSIAYDPYKMEVVENSEYFLKGGDGGCNICGGLGMVFGYLPTATYFRSESLSDGRHQKDIGGEYTFYRRIVRL